MHCIIDFFVAILKYFLPRFYKDLTVSLFLKQYLICLKKKEIHPGILPSIQKY